MARSDKARLESERVGESQTTTGKAVLQQLAGSLKARGVPATSYVMVDIISCEFVTGKTPEEARNRFELLHPGANGWMQRFSDVIGGPAEVAEDDEESPVGRPRYAASMRDRRFARRPS